MKNNIVQKVISIINNFKQEREKNYYKPIYKLVEIREIDNEYTVVIKMINKNITFIAKPEEVLANDYIVDCFSPRDIRTLTYLGYLGVNGAKYKILAKKLSLDEKIIFLLKKKGEKRILIKTADQICYESDIILDLNSEDAKTIGYTLASETIMHEKMSKELLLSEFTNK